MTFPSPEQRKALDEVKETIAYIAEKIKTNMTRAQRQDWEYLIQKKREDLDALEKEIWNSFILDPSTQCVHHPYRNALYGKTVCDRHKLYNDESCICFRPVNLHSYRCETCNGVLDEFAISRMENGI
jgi:hypothetical protein